MPVKVYKPTSAGRRSISQVTFDAVTRGKPERSLVEGRVNKSGGRNSKGRVTTTSPWLLLDYWRWTREADLESYRVVESGDPARVVESGDPAR